MKKKQLAEAIFLFSRIENLLRQHGGKGESFSDLVKSFNKRLYQEERLKANKEYANTIGYKFYYDDGEYYVKDQYEYENGIKDELEKYESSKQDWREYIEYKGQLIGGFYNNLRTIGHERNQLMHQADYNIKNFSRFKKACYQVINYLEHGKTPWFPLSLHGNETLRKRITNIALDEPIFWFKYLLTLPVVYWIFKHYGICVSCPEAAFYGTIAGVSLFFFHLFYMLFGLLIFTFKSEDNMKAMIFFGMIGFFTYGHFFGADKTKEEKEQYAITKQQCEYYYVKAKSLNIRQNPSVQAYKRGILKQNQKVCVTREKKSWAYVDDRGWVAKKYLSKTKEHIKQKVEKKTAVVSHEKEKQIFKKVKRIQKKVHKPMEVWHCEARAKRASGWVEKVGKENAIKGALHQCKIRRVTEVSCSISHCYRVQ